MKVVVDTNIIFSILLNSQSTIGKLFFTSDKYFEFYSCTYMRYEILKHWKKLLNISKLSDETLQISYSQVLSKLHFVKEETTLITAETLLEASGLQEIST